MKMLWRRREEVEGDTDEENVHAARGIEDGW